MATMQREEWLSRKIDGKGERWVQKTDGWLAERWMAEQKYGWDARQMSS
jgi:hypothetical protein